MELNNELKAMLPKQKALKKAKGEKKKHGWETKGMTAGEHAWNKTVDRGLDDYEANREH